MAKRFAVAILAAILILVASLPGDAQQSTAVPPPAAAPTSAPPLTIGSGDLIDVGIFDSPELSGRFRVNQNGDVTLPLVGPVHVQGLTAEQAGKVIEDRFIEAQFLKPQASQTNVFIEEYATQGITVAGEVKTAGIYPAFGVRMLNDVLVAAGGVTPLAASKAVITRKGDPQHPVTVPYVPEALSPVIPEVQIFPGDTVVIPRAGIVYVLGDVQRSGGYVIDGRNPITLEVALALAGGTGRAPALKDTRVVRKLPDGRKEMITVPVDKILKGKSPDLALEDGDIVYVPTSTRKLAAEQAINSALQIGSQVTIYRTAIQ